MFEAKCRRGVIQVAEQIGPTNHFNCRFQILFNSESES